MKLSKAQGKLLAEIAKYGNLFISWAGEHYYFEGLPISRIDGRTVCKLRDIGLIEWETGNGEPGHYVITPAGRAALEAEGGR